MLAFTEESPEVINQIFCTNPPIIIIFIAVSAKNEVVVEINTMISILNV